MATRKLTIYIHTFDGSGHLNACIGLAQALHRRGHSVVFLLNAASKGHFSKYNFEEILLERTSEPEGPPSFGESADNSPEAPFISPVKAFAQIILNSGMLNGKSPLEKIKGEVEVKDTSFAENIYASSVDFNLQIKAAIQNRKPDLIILDHFYVPPAILEAGVPWLLQFSSNPLAVLNSADLPPCTSGYPTAKEAGDEQLWSEFRRYQAFSRDAFIKYQRMLYDHFGYQVNEAEDMPFPGGLFPQCKFGYIYGYPAELDYDDLIDIPEHFIRMDTFCREEKEKEKSTFKLPEGFAKEGDKLIYFSLGSMGSADYKLVLRVASLLSSRTPYKTIVSKGPFADEYELPERCWGEEYLPQTKILPMVDLVITHGGNNTVTESFSFGKPMIVLPLFGDQFDNAQRIQEKHFGRRLDTYNFKDQELVDAVEKLINDQQLKKRLQAASRRIATAGSKEKACIKIEAVVEKYRNK